MPAEGPQVSVSPPPQRRPVLFWVLAVIIVAVALLLVARPRHRRPPCGPELPAPESTFAGGTRLLSGEVLASALTRWGLSPECINRVYAALAGTDFPFRGMKPGDSVTFHYQGIVLVGLTYHRDLAVGWRVDFDSAGTRACQELKRIDTLRTVVRGTIEGSLWNSLIGQGESPALVVNFAEILGYEVDFLTECANGDSYEILLDRLFVDSMPYRDGRIHAVHYRGAAGDFYGYYFRSPNGHWDYYNDKGQSLRKTVLRSPLQFARVTSHFGNRLHPITRRWRSHTGVDYGAPTGTPVSCVADGVVTMARYNGGYGKFVEVSHSGGLKSRYGHLSSYGPGIASGRRVRQGQLVGRVGSTGFSTGPHLHFEILQNGRAVNPLKVIPPRADPVPKNLMAEFERVKTACRAQLALPAGPIVPADTVAGR